VAAVKTQPLLEVNMADRFYSVVFGEQQVSQVTEGSSTSSEAIELRISDSVYSKNKASLICSVKAILNYLITKETSPIA
jgi:hypothetical protein